MTFLTDNYKNMWDNKGRLRIGDRVCRIIKSGIISEIML